jgi:hypothetical protein
MSQEMWTWVVRLPHGQEVWEVSKIDGETETQAIADFEARFGLPVELAYFEETKGIGREPERKER